MVFASLAVALAQRDPGGAEWDLGRERTWEGVLRASPYPMLFIESGDDAGVALLVEQGKRGSAARSAKFDGERVRVRGWRLERDGRRIVELAPEADAIVRIDGPRAAATPVRSLGPAIVRGEIMDAKCFLGAMKPGEGMTHKSCAILCLTGGIPPMLVSRDAKGRATYRLLTDESGGPIPAAFITLAGEPVEARGELRRMGDLELLAVRAGGVKRR